MEVLQSTAKLQQTQMGTARATQTEAPASQSVQQLQKAQINQEKVPEANTEAKTTKVSSQENMDALIEKLNKSLNPFNTTLRFGYDDSFYVSVIDTQSNTVLRRFPLEQAQQLLPKMQEVTGMLFDIKG